jgi:hypothetical protein
LVLEHEPAVRLHGLAHLDLSHVARPDQDRVAACLDFGGLLVVLRRDGQEAFSGVLSVRAGDAVRSRPVLAAGTRRLCPVRRFTRGGTSARPGEHLVGTVKRRARTEVTVGAHSGHR